MIVSMLDERGRGFALGAADYLVKPVTRDHVAAALALRDDRAGNRAGAERRPVGARVAGFRRFVHGGYRVLRATDEDTLPWRSPKRSIRR